MSIYTKGIPDYCANVKAHKFVGYQSIVECGMEAVAMVDNEWNSIQEKYAINDNLSFEKYILGESTDVFNESIGDRIVEIGKKIVDILKKILSFIMGMISKFIISLATMLNKNKNIAKDKGRILNGAKNIVKKNDGIWKFTGTFIKENHNINFTGAFAELNVHCNKWINNKNLDKSKEFLDDNDNIDTIFNLVCGKFINKGAINKDDFKGELKKFLYNIPAGTEDVDGDVFEYEVNDTNVSNMVNKVCNNINKGYDDNKKIAKEAFEKIKKLINIMINDMNNKVKNVSTKGNNTYIEDDDKREDSVIIFNTIGSMYKKFANMCTSVNSTLLSVLAADSRSCMTFALKCYMAGGKK